MTTPAETPKEGSGGGTLLLIVALVAGFFVLSNDAMRAKVFAAIEEFFHPKGPTPTPRPVPIPARDPLVGTWQGRLTSGADEVLSFEPLGAFDEGVMSRNVYLNGKLIESWTGKYKHWTNPLLPAEDRNQIRMKWVDPARSEKEQFVILRSLSAETLVIKGLYDPKLVQYQRKR